MEEESGRQRRASSRKREPVGKEGVVDDTKGSKLQGKRSLQISVKLSWKRSLKTLARVISVKRWVQNLPLKAEGEMRGELHFCWLGGNEVPSRQSYC